MDSKSGHWAWKPASTRLIKKLEFDKEILADQGVDEDDEAAN
ncbi:MAG: hypothetical protein ABSF87_18590 [Xanthobacteraceae bacterium]